MRKAAAGPSSPVASPGRSCSRGCLSSGPLPRPSRPRARPAPPADQKLVLQRLQDELAAVGTALSRANAAVDAKKAESGKLQDELPALQKAVTDTDQAVATQQGEIAALNVDLDKLVAAVTDLNVRIGAKEAEVLALQARVAPLLAQLAGLNKADQ